MKTPVDKAVHDVFQILGRQLAVRDLDQDLRHQPLEKHSHMIESLHTVMQEVDLPAPRHFLPNCLRDELFVELLNNGFDRQTIVRGCFQHGHIPDFQQRHMKRSWNRCGGERKTSTMVLISFSRSLSFTPKRCSSSTTSRPRFLNFTSFCSSR